MRERKESLRNDKQRDLLIQLAKTMGDSDAKDNRSFFDKVKDVIS